MISKRKKAQGKIEANFGIKSSQTVANKQGASSSVG